MASTHAEGMRTSEIVFYIGPDFGTFSTFEMGEPFRIVLDLRRPRLPSAAGSAVRSSASGRLPTFENIRR